MKNICVLFIMLLYSTYMCCDDCRGNKLDCNTQNLYGIRVCNFTTGKTETICVRDMSDIPSNMKPALVSGMPKSKNNI